MLFNQLNPVVQSLIGTGFTWLATAIGSATVFFFRKINHLFLETMLGFAAGAMIYVVAEEIIPEAERNKHNHFATISVILGFAMMMLLELTLQK